MTTPTSGSKWYDAIISRPPVPGNAAPERETDGMVLAHEALVSVLDAELAGAGLSNEGSAEIMKAGLDAASPHIAAAILREAVSDFESNVGVGEFDEQTRRKNSHWAHIEEAWEHQGPYMDWLRNRADEKEAEATRLRPHQAGGALPALDQSQTDVLAQAKNDALAPILALHRPFLERNGAAYCRVCFTNAGHDGAFGVLWPCPTAVAAGQ